MRRALWALAMCSASAIAQSSTAVIAAGDCRDPDLMTHARLLQKELHARSPGVLDEEALRERLAPASPRSAEEVARGLEAAQMEFYQSYYGRAEEHSRLLLADVARLPPGKERWELAVHGQLINALALWKLNKMSESDAAFLRVLELDPQRQLDPDLYSPNTRSRFERLRRELATYRKSKLEVTSHPVGAEVFIDGQSVGKTPFKTVLMPGSYQVLVSREGGVSLPHVVQLAGTNSLHVDLQFEQLIHPERAPCLTVRPDERNPLVNANKLGTLLAVDDVVVISLERQAAGPSWLTAAVLNVQSAQRIREGGLKVPNLNRPPEGLGELADFIITGKAGKQLMVNSSTPAPVATVLTPLLPAPAVSTPRLVAAPSGARRSEPTATLGSRGEPSSWRRPTAYAVGGLGVIAVGAAIYFQMQSATDWTQFNSYYANGSAPSRQQLPLPAYYQTQAQTNQAFATVGFIAGGVLLAGGAGLLAWDWLGRPSGTAWRLTPTIGGASLSAQWN